MQWNVVGCSGTNQQLMSDLCHNTTACPAMVRDLQLNDQLVARKRTSKEPVPREQAEALARLMTSLTIGRCYHCKRKIR